MEAAEPVVREYERELRRSLTGLPSSDVDSVVRATLERLRAEASATGSVLAGIKAVGPPHKLGAAMVTALVRPEQGTGLGVAPMRRRAVALVPDVLLAWGPLLAASGTAVVLGFAGSLLWLIPASIATAAWGTWYWRGPRRRSASLGLRLAGLTRLNIGEERVAVRTRDLAGALANTPLRPPSRSR